MVDFCCKQTMDQKRGPLMDIEKFEKCFTLGKWVIENNVKVFSSTKDKDEV